LRQNSHYRSSGFAFRSQGESLKMKNRQFVTYATIIEPERNTKTGFTSTRKNEMRMIAKQIFRLGVNAFEKFLMALQGAISLFPGTVFTISSPNKTIRKK
jgi:hypothetical protein